MPEDEGGDINVARQWPGHEVLTLNTWTIQRNDEWVAGVIAKRQPIYLATPIDDASLATSDPRFDQSIFARELNQVLNSGVPYDFSEDGTYLLPRIGQLSVPYDQVPVPVGGQMSSSAELLSRLAEEGYVSRRIPGDCDAEIADFLNQIQSGEVFAAISQDLTAATAWILLAFADRAASYAVRIRDARWVGDGIMAAQLASTKIDPREALVIYSILYRAAELLDGDPIGAFREAASRAPVQIGDFTIEFSLRDDEDKSITSMGYVEGVDDDGFAFLRTW